MPEATAGDVHYPGTYVAGGYNRLETEVEGRVVENEDLVNFPNWLYLRFRISDGQWFSIDDVDLLHFRQELDLHTGILYREMRFSDDEDRITELAERRFVHMARPHPAGL
jgi:alpha,alpha-trehalase